jgi:hypothetical protein
MRDVKNVIKENVDGIFDNGVIEINGYELIVYDWDGNIIEKEKLIFTFEDKEFYELCDKYYKEDYDISFLYNKPLMEKYNVVIIESWYKERSLKENIEKYKDTGLIGSITLELKNGEKIIGTLVDIYDDKIALKKFKFKGENIIWFSSEIELDNIKDYNFEGTPKTYAVKGA